MTPEKFKGDATELKFDAAASPIFDKTSGSLDEFYLNGYDAAPFLLMLYDEKRVPFSERINKIAFVDFIRETLQRFPFIGTFETYIFILKAVFGQFSEINFAVDTAGILEIDINATSSLEFDFVAKLEDGTLDEMIDTDGNILTFRGVAGIETEYELELLFSEIMPAGISPQITLTFFARSNFVAEDDLGNLDDVITNLGDQIIFTEIG